MRKILICAMLTLGALMTAPAHASHDDWNEYVTRLEAERGLRHASPPVKNTRGRVVANPEVYRLVTQTAVAHGIDPAVMHAVVIVESRYQCAARSRDGAKGIAQVLPATARGVGVNGNLFDCRIGLEAGARYLKQAIQMHGNTCAAYSAYNTGIYRSGRCTAYGRKIVALAQSRRG